MTAAIVPFRKSSGRGPRSRASGREPCEWLSAAQAQTIRETRRKIFECRQLRAEAERVRRGYVERRAGIEALLAGIEASVEREGR